MAETLRHIGSDEFIKQFVTMSTTWVDPELKENAWLLTGQAIDENDMVMHKAKEPNRVMCHVATLGDVNRKREQVVMAGGKFKNFALNPVVTWAHKYEEMLIGNAIRVRRELDKDWIKIWTEYMTADLYPWADTVFRIMKAGWLKACSIGFQPLKTTYGDPEDEKGPLYIFEEWDLGELAMCCIGANPRALRVVTDSLGSAGERQFWGGWDPGEFEKTEQSRRICIRDINGFCTNENLSVPEVLALYATKKLEAPSNVIDNLERIGGGKIGMSCKEDDLVLEFVADELDLWIGEDEIDEELIKNPYPNEHSCRLKNPSGYTEFARKNCYKKHDGKCIDYIFGVTEEGNAELQAMRYPKKSWTESAARAHCKDAKGTFEAASTTDIIGDHVTSTYHTLTAIKRLLIKDILPRLDRIEKSSVGNPDRTRQGNQDRPGAGQTERDDLSGYMDAAANLFSVKKEAKGGGTKNE